MGWLVNNLCCYWRQLILIATPIILLPLPVICSTYVEARCAYVILIMAIYWMSEAVPLPVTALIPLFAFPILGIMGTKEVCLNYMIDPIMLFLGGLMFAAAVEFSHLDRRIALFVLKHTGKNLRLLIGGFMGTTMLLSMWINNAAATAIMVPTIEAILCEIAEKKKKPTHLVIPKITITDMEENKERSVSGEVNEAFETEDKMKIVSSDSPNESEDAERSSCEVIPSPEDESDASEENFSKCIYLSVAYAANIGGTGVLTGTPPNLVLMGILSKSFNEKTELNFSSWMAFNIPGMIICTIIAWAWLQYFYMGASKGKKTKRQEEKEAVMQKVIRAKYDALGCITFHEWTIMALFLLLLLLWVFRSPGSFPGWSIYFESLFGDTIEVSDTSSVMLIVFLLFASPSNLPSVLESKTSKPMPCKGCLTWSFLQQKIPWGIVLLIGSGFALSDAANQSRLSYWIGQQLKGLSVLPVPLLIFLITVVAVVITNVASNNATAAILLPVLKELSLVLCVNPLYLMIPATVACSYAFMLPVATPPNAIVYYTGVITPLDMIKAGFMMNILCVVVINIMINSLGEFIFQLDDLPHWINSTSTGYVLDC